MLLAGFIILVVNAADYLLGLSLIPYTISPIAIALVVIGMFTAGKYKKK
jgi:hypothetical protein